ncbi:Fc.00g074500.m01.CDS01 [Cosmosporella sp. VM-42]
MSDFDHFDLLPLAMNPQSKAIETLQPSRALNAELEELNSLHRAILNIENGAPPAPLPVNAKRSANVAKLRESGLESQKKGKFLDAIKFYSLGLQMALGRPGWEPSGLVREEIWQLLVARAQAHMSLSNWPEAALDAQASVENMWQNNAKAWLIRGRALSEMGRFEEAKEWMTRAVQIDGKEPELQTLLKEIEVKI